MTKQEQLADVAVGVSVATFLGITLVEWNTIVHIIAGLVAIVTGIAAAWYHIKRTKYLDKHDKI